MSVLRQITNAVFVCLAATATALHAPAQAPDLPTIVTRMSAAQHEEQAKYGAYQLMRRYQVFDSDDKGKARTELIAKIDFAPPGQKSYTIEKSTGGMGERAIRHALDHEVDLTKSPERVEMTERNYTFSYAGEETIAGERCYVLESHPKRNDSDLLKAKIWVDTDDFHIRRVSGHPQKSPSFWVKDVDLTLEYGQVHGMWMHTSTRAEAQIRFSGPFTLVSRDLSLQVAPQVAKAQSRRQPRHEIFAGSALHGIR